MRIEALGPGWATDLFLHRHGAIVIERPDCLVVRTPENPTFYWGNFLLLPEAPADADLAHWLQRFDDEIASVQPASDHVAIGVNEVQAPLDLPSWRAAGLQLIDNAVLRLEPGQLRTPARAARAEARFERLDLERDLETIVAFDGADAQGFEPQAYAEYRRRQLRRYARMARDDAAGWFGLHCEGRLAAACGLMRGGPQGRIGRFQRVATHPDFRRRGLCSALVHAVSAWGFEHWGLTAEVMCADPDDVAIGIYESLGYRRIAAECCLQRNAPRDRAAASA